MHRSRAGFGVILVLLLGLAACGSGPASTSPAGPVPDPNATFNFNLSPIDSLDPVQSKVTNAGIELSPVYESLIVLKPDGSFLPGLATDWSFVNSGSTFRLKLRKGVKFQDGTPFNAQAVKANLDRVLTFPGSTLTALLAAVKQVDVVDDSTVDLQLRSGGATLPALLADSPGRMVSPATFGNPQYLSFHPVGTGPFRFVSYRPDDLLYERNPDYWGKKAPYAKLDFHILSTDLQTRINAITTGVIDAVTVSAIKQAQVDQLRATPGLKVDPIIPASGWFISFNRGRAPFDNEMVRQALGYAIDRKQIAKALNVVAKDEPTIVGSRFANDKYRDYYTYDPAKARKMLADAGYPNGIDLGELNTLTSWLEYAQVVQSELAAVGIRGQLRAVSSSPEIIALCYTGQKCPLFIGAHIERQDPVRLSEELFLPDALQNMGRTAPAGVLQKLSSAEQPTSDSDHLTRVRDLVGQIVVDAPNQFVADVNNYVVYRSNVSNLTANWDISGFPDYNQVVKSK